MSKTFKFCTIYFIAAVWVVVVRIIFSSLNLSDNISNWLFSFIVQIIGLGIIPMLLYKFWAKEKVSCLIRSKAKISPRIILLAILIGLFSRQLTIAIAVLWQNFIMLLGFTQINSAGTIFSSPEVIWLELICTALLPAIFEEITHRGLLQDALSDVKTDRSKIIIMAIMFGLMHQNVNQVCYTIVGGMIMAYLAVKTGSLLPGMIVHFMNNAFSVLSSYSQQTNGLFNYYGEMFNNFLYGNAIILLLVWVFSGVLVYFLLVKVKDISLKNKLQDRNSCNNYYNQENVYNYNYNNNSNNVQQMDNVFGYSSSTNIIKSKAKWYEYAFLYGTIALCLATTIFSFYWGLLR